MGWELQVQAESERDEVARDLGTAASAKAESEKRRKAAESALAELQLRFAEADKSKGETAGIIAKLRADLEAALAALEEAEARASTAAAKAESLEGQLKDTAELLEEETRLKLAFQGKVCLPSPAPLSVPHLALAVRRVAWKRTWPPSKTSWRRRMMPSKRSSVKSPHSSLRYCHSSAYKRL